VWGPQRPLMGLPRPKSPQIIKMILKMGNVRLYLVITNKI
jgi:hypothetical protein